VCGNVWGRGKFDRGVFDQPRMVGPMDLRYLHGGPLGMACISSYKAFESPFQSFVGHRGRL